MEKKSRIFEDDINFLEGMKDDLESAIDHLEEIYNHIEDLQTREFDKKIEEIVEVKDILELKINILNDAITKVQSDFEQFEENR